MKKKIVIVGASGSGKTTLGQKLATLYKVPFCDIDDLSWLPGWQLQSKEKEREQLEQIAKQDSWVIVGNYSRHFDITLYGADEIIWLDIPFWLCLWGGFSRAVKNIVYKRSICNGNYDSWRKLFQCNDNSIVYWIWSTHGKKKKRYTHLLEEAKDPKLAKHYRLRNRRDIQKLLQIKRDELNAAP